MENIDRDKLLQSLDESIAKTTGRLDQILKQFGWDKDTLMKEPDLCQCPIDRNHFIAKERETLHNKHCCLRKQQLTRKEAEEVLSLGAFYKTENNRLVYNPDDIADVVTKLTRGAPTQDLPLNPPHVRLAVYDELVANTKQRKQTDAIDDELFFLDRKGWEKKKEEGEKDRKSRIEQLAEMRDMRRRRQTYRAKNVHTTRKSHTEIIREVIGNQMEVLEKILQDEAEYMASAPKSGNSREGSNPREDSNPHSHEGSRSRDGERSQKYDEERRRDRLRHDDKDKDEGQGRDQSGGDGEQSRPSHDDGGRDGMGEQEDRGRYRDGEDRERSHRHKKKHKKKRSRSRSRDRQQGSETDSNHKRHKKHKHKRDRERSEKSS